MAPPKSKQAGPATRGLQIAAKREQFFSGGITQPFGFEARVIPLSDLSKEQVEELTNDPFLVVKEVDVEPPAEPKA